ncbi:MAG: UDP-N-acetylmuramoyl-L-alanine--D-glutamate ligase [Oscillospiraceae bacterium]
MNTKLEQFYKDIRNKKLMLLGAGISHRKLMRMFREKGAEVILCDKKPREQLEDYCEEARALGVSLILGDDYLEHLNEADMIFRTPGIDYTKPQIRAAVANNIKVTSEIEMFMELCPCRIIGVTGSDGKTTTTTMIAHLLTRQGYRVHLGGNLGVPLLPEIEKISNDDIAVIELSSFQLISSQISPWLSVMTNVVQNHLDHHKDMDEYVNAKRNILLHQSSADIAVINEDNDITRKMKTDVSGELRLFSRRGAVENGAYVNESQELVLCCGGKKTVVCNLKDMQLVGNHNRENAAAAAAAVMSLVTPKTMKEVILSFEGVEHRIEFVRERRGVRWFNDSIATTPTRTLAGLKSFDKNIILLAGGSDKKLVYDEAFARELVLRTRLLILCGPTSKKIEDAVKSIPESGKNLKIIKSESLAQSVKLAEELSMPGDTVLLSPASASFDAYTGFEERGKHFKEMVGKLQ